MSELSSFASLLAASAESSWLDAPTGGGPYEGRGTSERASTTDSSAHGASPWELDSYLGNADTRWEELRERVAAAGAPMSAGFRAHLLRHAGKHWNDFYGYHEAGFFLPRSYLERDFPVLLKAHTEPLTLLEFGCGTGAAFLPLLSRLPHLVVAAFDLSRKAVALAREDPAFLAAAGRAVAFAHDATSTAVPVLDATAAALCEAADVLPAPLRGLAAPAFDCVLLLFMLSAMPRELHARVFSQAASCLRPGGLLLFRDYGQLDAAQLRFPRGRLFEADGSTWVRGDGTLAHFFSLEQLRGMAAAAGLEETEAAPDEGVAAPRAPAAFPRVPGGGCVYLARRYQNRAQGVTLRRVFVHAVFRKPLW